MTTSATEKPLGLPEALAEIERLEAREADLLQTAQRYQARYRDAEAKLALYHRATMALGEVIVAMHKGEGQ